MLARIMTSNIEGNTAIITAAGSGLGKATAIEFVRNGVNVVINDVDGQNLKKAKEEITELTTPESVVAVQGDLTDRDDIKNIVETATSEYETLDHLVISSGGPPAGPFLEKSDEDWDFAHELLLMSVVRLCRECYPYLKQDGGGTIINSTSRSVKESIDGLVLSNAVRSGVAGLSKTLSKEFAPEVRTNIVLPGPTETQRMEDLIVSGIESGKYDDYEDGRASKAEGVPLGRVAQPEEFAQVVVFLSSPEASYINGAAIPIDGGSLKSNV